jgi:ubiquinone/menaquinone biosynthesis C-methylase UbiE
MSSYALQISDTELSRYRNMAARALQQETAAWTTAGFVSGARVADIGCGPAAILVELARIVGPTGEAIGVERDAASATMAEQVIAASGAVNARVVRAPAAQTGLQPGSIDAVMVRNVLIHNAADSIRDILEHIASLLRPGGQLYVIDTDLEGHRVVPVEADLEDQRRRYWELLRRRGCDPRIGPRLGRLLADAGFDDIRHDAWFIKLDRLPVDTRPPEFAARQALIDEGLATTEDGERWDAALLRLRETANPAVFLPVYRAVGRKLG